MVCHQPVDDFVHRFRRDVTAAFILPFRSFQARAPFKVFMVEDYLRIVPAAVADVVVDDPVGCGKFVKRQGKAADEYDRYAYAVGYPTKTAGQSDEEVGMV